ncbi:MAG: hypothetical protein QM528_05180, partial [Phycisphaerales bacterium]|nr:hypothetical protein [Phycisphaerales bacterium]
MLKQLSLIKKILVVLLLIALYLSESRLFYLTFLLPLFLLLYPLAYPLLKDRDSDLVKSSSGYKIIMPRVLRLYFVFCFILTLLFFWSILSIGIGY